MGIDIQKELRDKADALYYDREYFQSIQVYEEILSSDPYDHHSREYLHKSRIRLTVEESDKFIKSNNLLPKKAERLFRKAASLSMDLVSDFNEKDYQDATSALKESLEICNSVNSPYIEAEKLLAMIETEIRKEKLPRVFLSYARDDFDTAKEIYSILSKNYAYPWMDAFDLLPGDEWEWKIKLNIKMADFFIALLSNHSVSKRGYVQKELKLALSVLEQIPEGEIFLIPVRLDDCLVPESLKDKHWLDWSSPNSQDRLVKAIKSKKQ